MCYIHTFFKILFGVHDNGIDRAALWTGAAAVAAFIAIGIAIHELKSTRETTRADFAKRFVDSFFTRDTRELLTLLMNSALEFEVLKIKDKEGKQIDSLPYFKINEDIARQLHGIIENNQQKTGYSAFEMDDLLLGHFEDIAWYEGRKLIDLETIREMFGYQILACYENAEIQKYLSHKCNKGNFANFKRLAKIIDD
jgi:hypothetical protein